MGFMEFLPLIGDVVSGLFGNKATSSANSTNLQLNRENNAANRANMERQNQLNIEQWNRENAYNHPAAQMGRFTAAGLNPNLIYGQTNTAPQLSGSLGSSTSQAGSVMPNDAMSKMFGKLGETLMRIPMYKAEVEGKRIDNDLKRQELFEKQTTASARFLGIDLSNQALRAQIDNVQRSTALLEDTASNVRAHTANIEADTVLKRIESVVTSNESVARIRLMEAQTKLSESQCKEILTLLPAQLLGLQLENDNLSKYGIKVDAETQQIVFDYNSDLEWKDQERTLNAWDYIIGYARDIASIVGTAFGGNYSETMTNSVKDGVQTVTRKGKRR